MKTEITTIIPKKVWRLHDGTPILAHAIWEGSWFVGTLDRKKPGRIVQHPVLNMRAASREQMEQILAAYAKEYKWRLIP